MNSCYRRPRIDHPADYALTIVSGVAAVANRRSAQPAVTVQTRIGGNSLVAHCHYKVLSLHSDSIFLNMQLIVLLEIIAIHA